MASSKDSVTVKNKGKAVPSSTEAFPTTLPSARPGSSAQDFSEDGHHLQHQDSMSRPQGLRETQVPGPSEASLETAFRRSVQPVDTRGNFGSPASVAEGQPLALPMNLKHGSSPQELNAVGATAATTSANDSVIAHQRSTEGVDITSADKHQRGSTEAEVPSHAASPSLSGTATSAQLPRVGISRHTSGTRSPAMSIEGHHASGRGTKTSNRRKPHGAVSPHRSLPTHASTSTASRRLASRSPASTFPASTSPASRSPAPRLPASTSPALNFPPSSSPDTTDSSKFCDSPTYADLSSGHSPKPDGRLVSDERGIRHLDHPPSKAGHSSGRPPREQHLKSRKLSLVHETPSGSVGRVKPRLIKATGRTVDAHNKERKEDVATPSVTLELLVPT